MVWTAENSQGYPSPVALAADAVVLTVRDGELVVLGVEREDGTPALPGGFVGSGEDPAQTLRRTLADATGVEQPYLEQLATFARPDRDPRGWIPSIAYLALVPPITQPTRPASRWLAVADREPMAFDHDAMLDAAIERIEGKLWWSNVAVGILPGAFSMTDARTVYEAIANVVYDPASFARDLKATGLVESTGDRRSEGPGRPAALYRFASEAPAWGAGRRKRVHD